LVVAPELGKKKVAGVREDVGRCGGGGGAGTGRRKHGGDTGAAMQTWFHGQKKSCATGC